MKVVDPVCGMSIESEKAHATKNHQGQTIISARRSATARSRRIQGNSRPRPARAAAEPATAGIIIIDRIGAELNCASKESRDVTNWLAQNRVRVLIGGAVAQSSRCS